MSLQSKTYVVLNFVEKYVSEKEKVNVFITIIIEYASLCQNKQSFEYARCLSMPDIVHSL